MFENRIKKWIQPAQDVIQWWHFMNSDLWIWIPRNQLIFNCKILKEVGDNFLSMFESCSLIEISRRFGSAYCLHQTLTTAQHQRSWSSLSSTPWSPESHFWWKSHYKWISEIFVFQILENTRILNINGRCSWELSWSVLVHECACLLYDKTSSVFELIQEWIFSWTNFL